MTNAELMEKIRTDVERRAHIQHLDSDESLMRVSDVSYPDGHVGDCYALVTNGSAISVRPMDAQSLAADGMPFVDHPVYPDDFIVFYRPDFTSGNIILVPLAV